jgi:hemerythrin-like domain-containing protein
VRLMSTAAPFPGFDSPGVGFEQPFEMLEACHDRVRRSLALLEKLVDYLDTHGHDTQSRSAAADVLRYFDLAAPLHHADEEAHVFPLLLSQGDALLRTAVRGLQSDHQRMGVLWAAVREPLLRWCQPGYLDSVPASTRATVTSFRTLYDTHLATEEGLAFPTARSHMAAAELHDMGRQMQARRRV